MAVRLKMILIGSALLVAALLVAAMAQPYGPVGAIMRQGMMGPWVMGRHSFGGICNQATSGFAGWRADRIAELAKPTDAQRASFDEFRVASIKSADILRTACQADIPETIVDRTEAMERRMDATLQAVRNVRPALEAFYATLSDEQKARLDSGYRRGRFWHWHARW